jgi:hypothetical protein
MFNYRICRLLLLVMLVLSVAIIAWPQPKPVAEVWAIGSGQDKVYHCPGSRWFGVGAGKKIGECQAQHEGYKPAFGTGCGSSCLNASSLTTPGSTRACRDEAAGTNRRSL